MNYSNYTDFSHDETYNQSINHMQRTNKEYFLRAGIAHSLPKFLKYIDYYLLLNNIAIYLPSTNRISRTTELNYYFADLTRKTRVQQDSDDYNLPLLFSNLQRDAFTLKETFGLHLIEVVGQIQDTFERAIPTWASANEATEVLGISLALKLSPKHRVRVYTRNEHVIVFTTKGLTNTIVDDDYKFYRKLWACLPLIKGWHTNEQDQIYTDITQLCKSLDNDDSTLFWTLLEQLYDSNEAIKDLKYSNIIQAFNSVSAVRQTVITRQIQEHDNNIRSYLEQYAAVLEQKHQAQLRLLDLQQSDTPIETNTIKMLVDKKICYALDINRLTDTDGSLSYRCSAPLLSYDKAAAQGVYNRRIVPYHNKDMCDIFKLLFIDEKAVLLFDQSIKLRLNRSTFTARGGETGLTVDFNNSFPNPHHYYYNCWGSYGPIITKLIREYKLEEVFYQIKAAMGSLNFTDPPVISQFIDVLECITDGTYNPACFLWRDENCTTLHTCKETLDHFREETTE